jgi:predicted transcriptional regulator
MATLLELVVEIVSAHASATSMTKDELIAEITSVYQALAALEKGNAVTVEPAAAEHVGPAVTKKKAFGKDKVFCMICGKGMKTLARHLKTVHALKPGQYRKQFSIPRTQSLTAKSYSESRRQMAIDRRLGEKLTAARTTKQKRKISAPKLQGPPKKK